MTDTAPRPAYLTEEQRYALRQILRKGGLAALGTEASRGAWYDGIPAAVAALGALFTPEELDTITEGTR